MNVSDILRRVYGFRGLPFPSNPNTTPINPIAGDFEGGEDVKIPADRTRDGSPLWGVNALGRPVFLPVKLGGQELPNPLIMISGEKSIMETDVIEIGTVFEKVFDKPYDVIIICTLINEEDQWPEEQIRAIQKLYKEGDLYTLECALTDIFLQPRDNFILKKIDVLEMQGIENSQVIELSGRSNVDFELEIL